MTHWSKKYVVLCLLFYLHLIVGDPLTAVAPFKLSGVDDGKVDCLVQVDCHDKTSSAHLNSLSDQKVPSTKGDYTFPLHGGDFVVSWQCQEASKSGQFMCDCPSMTVQLRCRDHVVEPSTGYVLYPVNEAAGYHALPSGDTNGLGHAMVADVRIFTLNRTGDNLRQRRSLVYENGQCKEIPDKQGLRLEVHRREKDARLYEEKAKAKEQEIADLFTSKAKKVRDELDGRLESLKVQFEEEKERLVEMWEARLNKERKQREQLEGRIKSVRGERGKLEDMLKREREEFTIVKRSDSDKSRVIEELRQRLKDETVRAQTSEEMLRGIKEQYHICKVSSESNKTQSLGSEGEESRKISGGEDVTRGGESKGPSDECEKCNCDHEKKRVRWVKGVLGTTCLALILMHYLPSLLGLEQAPQEEAGMADDRLGDKEEEEEAMNDDEEEVKIEPTEELLTMLRESRSFRHKVAKLKEEHDRKEASGTALAGQQGEQEGIDQEAEEGVGGAGLRSSGQEHKDEPPGPQTQDHGGTAPPDSEQETPIQAMEGVDGSESLNVEEHDEGEDGWISAEECSSTHSNESISHERGDHAHDVASQTITEDLATPSPSDEEENGDQKQAEESREGEGGGRRESQTQIEDTNSEHESEYT